MTTDPRPLTSEPFALDLVNTLWIGAAGPQDLIADAGATRLWLEQTGHPDAPADRAARAALIEARKAIRACIPHGLDPERRAALDVVLGHGELHVRAGQGGARERLDVDHERWRAPWHAVRQFLELFESQPGRLRECANHECVLVFLDVSRNGRRQWCSMESCGNRAKARRHYARTRTAS